MTPPDSPSALLERAAEAIEFFAKQASPGPWSIGLFGHLVCDAAGETVASNIPNEADDRWIKAMSPAVAQPLVEWLRDSAASVREHDEDLVANGEPSRYCPNEEQALTFARLILGES